jgi:hypothetical protein
VRQGTQRANKRLAQLRTSGRYPEIIVRLYSTLAVAGQQRPYLACTAGKEVRCCIVPYRMPGWHRGSIRLVATTCTLCILLFASEARAQCTARDVLQNQLRLQKTPSANMRPILVKSAADVPAWKTISIGTFTDTFALRNALDAAGCSIGDLAGQILARPAFTISAAKTIVELLRYRRPNSALTPILLRWQTFMDALNSWVFDLPQQKSLRS